MDENEIFNALFTGGKYALPYLIRFIHPEAGVYRFINNNESASIDGEQYEVASFDYKPPDRNGEGATLKISAIDNDLIQFVEQADYRWRLDVTGILTANGAVQKLKQYTHFFGSISYGADMMLNFQLGRDDRLDMVFPPYTFDTDNNRANA